LGIDNFDPYYPRDYKLLRLKEILENPNFEFHEVDFSDKGSLRGVFEKGGISGILHIGAKAGVRASIRDPESYIKANVIGTLNILDLMVEFGIRRILMASTSSIYAGHKPPFVEDMKTDTPISPYAVSKKAAENLLYTYHHLYGLDAWVLRYFTVYGPAGRPDMSIFKLFYCAYSGEEFPVFGDGNQRRSFTFIDDVVEGTFSAYKVMKGFEVINIGNDRDESLMEVIGIIEEVTGRKIKVKFFEFNRADILETKADISKARRILGWEPKTDVYTGLMKTSEWFEENWERVREIFPRLPQI
jgi:nucleoside-diphosphate-sugar epimerase